MWIVCSDYKIWMCKIDFYLLQSLESKRLKILKDHLAKVQPWLKYSWLICSSSNGKNTHFRFQNPKIEAYWNFLEVNERHWGWKKKFSCLFCLLDTLNLWGQKPNSKIKKNNGLYASKIALKHPKITILPHRQLIIVRWLTKINYHSFIS